MTSGILSRPPEEGARLLALDFLDQAAAARLRLADPADGEALHDLRVGLRRLRSCLQAYRVYLEESVPRKLGRRLRRLARATGPGRDLEVQIDWLRGRRAHLSPYHRASLTWILSRLEARKVEAYGGLRDEAERELPAVEEKLRQRLSVYYAEVRLDGDAPRTTLATATAVILRRQVADLERHLTRIDDAADETAAHRARIGAKRLRYLLEPFAEEIAGAPPLVRRFKALQDLLGDLHDAHVLEAELRAAVDTAATERSRIVFEISLVEPADEDLLRAQRRRGREAGLIALARLNRARRNRLFAALGAEWLAGKADGFLRQVEELGERMTTEGAAEA